MHFVMDDLDPVVATAFERALKALSGVGVKIERIDLPELNELPHDQRQGRLRGIRGLCLASQSDRRAVARITTSSSTPASCAARR